MLYIHTYARETHTHKKRTALLLAKIGSIPSCIYTCIHARERSCGVLCWWGPTSPKQLSRAPHLFSVGITWYFLHVLYVCLSIEGQVVTVRCSSWTLGGPARTASCLVSLCPGRLYQLTRNTSPTACSLDQTNRHVQTTLQLLTGAKSHIYNEMHHWRTNAGANSAVLHDLEHNGMGCTV